MRADKCSGGRGHALRCSGSGAHASLLGQGGGAAGGNWQRGKTVLVLGQLLVQEVGEVARLGVDGQAVAGDDGGQLCAGEDAKPRNLVGGDDGGG